MCLGREDGRSNGGFVCLLSSSLMKILILKALLCPSHFLFLMMFIFFLLFFFPLNFPEAISSFWDHFPSS